MDSNDHSWVLGEAFACIVVKLKICITTSDPSSPYSNCEPPENIDVQLDIIFDVFLISNLET